MKYITSLSAVSGFGSSLLTKFPDYYHQSSNQGPHRHRLAASVSDSIYSYPGEGLPSGRLGHENRHRVLVLVQKAGVQLRLLVATRENRRKHHVGRRYQS